MRRSFTFASALFVALTVAWSSTAASAAALSGAAVTGMSPQALGAPHRATTPLSGTRSAPALGSSPTQLTAFPGGGEQTAVAAAAGGASAVTTPADPSIAAGVSDIVEAVNSAVFVFSRNGGTALKSFGINEMIASVPSAWIVRNPKVVYDPSSGRFVLMVLQFNPSGCGSQIAVLVSQPDPTLPWTSRGTLSIDAELGNAVELGNVSLALTSTLFIESSDYQSCVGGVAGAFVASQTDIIQRADLVSGTMGAHSVVAEVPGPLGLQPVTGLGLSTVAYEMANDSNCTAPAANSYAVFVITGTPDTQNTAVSCAAAGVESNGSSVPPSAPQSGTSAVLRTDDDRFLDAVWQGNTLWATGNTGCKPSGDAVVRSCINVVTASATTSGTVTAATQLTPEGVNGSYLYFPSLGVDNAGNAIVTFDESSSTTVESIMLASITGGSTWSSFIELQASLDYYAPGACTTCVWGDYSVAVQDALHPTDVWLASADNQGNTGGPCATANACWNTYIARYTFASPSVSALTPSSGTGSGGQLVTVSGSDFATGTTATIGGTGITPGSLTPDSFTFITPAGPATGGIEHVVATDSLGSSSATSTASAYLYIPLSNFTAVTPFRILDTRVPLQGPALGPGVTRLLQITGVGGTPVPSSAVAVVLNVTAVAGTASSLLSVYPAGSPRPSTSALNFTAGSVTPNLVPVAIGSGGAVEVFNAAGTVNVVVDVEGYFAPPASPTSAGEFHPISPTRVCDTRFATYSCHGVLVGGTPRLVTVAQGTIPNTGAAAAAVLNLTAVAGSASTYLIVYPTSPNGTCATGSNLPGAATLNVGVGAVEANRVMVRLGPTTTGGLDTSVCVYSAAGSINVVLDANGWFGSATAPAGYQYQATAPTRICDTRGGSPGCAAGAITGLSRLVGVAGQGGVPPVGGTVVQAVVANLTGIAPTLATYMVAYSASLTKAPAASDISLQAGNVRDNSIVVQLDTTAGDHDGFIDLFNAVGSVNATVDVDGWFQ